MATVSNLGNPAPYAVRAITEGLSGRQGLTEFREAGGRIADKTWYRIYGEAKASRDNLTAVSALDPSHLPTADQFAPWSAGVEGQYAYQFGMVTYDAETGLRATLQHTVTTPDIVPIGDAMTMALQTWDAADTQQAYGLTAVQPVLFNLYAMQGPPS